MRNANAVRAEDSAATYAMKSAAFTDTRRLSVAQLLKLNDEVVRRHYGAEVLIQHVRSR